MLAVEHLPAVGLSVVGWATCFGVSAAVSGKRYDAEFKGRAVSILHALVIVGLSLYVDGGDVATTFAHGDLSPGRRAILILATGYFLWDLVLCFMAPDVLMNLAHHVVSLASTLYPLLSGNGAQLLVAVLWTLEVPNPFMNLRFMLRAAEKGRSSYGLVNEVLFAAAYFVARGYFGVRLWWATIAAPCPLFLRAMSSLMLVVSTLWGVKIAQVAGYKIRQLLKMVTGGKKKA
ncbi:unnamed protein product [Pedinophyceae sp. YPF-701]|nr:unnamed protein product [Pedinophyceae sp. YPF-701]